MNDRNPTVSKDTLALYQENGVEGPSHDEHGEIDLSKFEKFQATRWWSEGNMLFAEGNHGIVANRIPMDYICLGMDEKLLPIMKKINVNQ